MIVVIPCGGLKRHDKCKAGEMYVGTYHVTCRQYAESLKPELILILSAKYGLLTLDTEIEPYELRMGNPGCVDSVKVQSQAKGMGILNATHIVALGGRDYTNMCRDVWGDDVVETPLAGIGAIGKQLSWMLKEIDNV